MAILQFIYHSLANDQCWVDFNFLLLQIRFMSKSLYERMPSFLLTIYLLVELLDQLPYSGNSVFKCLIFFA